MKKQDDNRKIVPSGRKLRAHRTMFALSSSPRRLEKNRMTRRMLGARDTRHASRRVIGWLRILSSARCFRFITTFRENSRAMCSSRVHIRDKSDVYTTIGRIRINVDTNKPLLVLLENKTINVVQFTSYFRSFVSSLVFIFLLRQTKSWIIFLSVSMSFHFPRLSSILSIYDHEEKLSTNWEYNEF